mmetsp:Transcript_40801/g.135061  ORF Transcript_40801/g.135061 Transcript_40801/m.135061 type:complete len:242 (-) Transcript_40801:3005-3730(-)
MSMCMRDFGVRASPVHRFSQPSASSIAKAASLARLSSATRVRYRSRVASAGAPPARWTARTCALKACKSNACRCPSMCSTRQPASETPSPKSAALSRPGACSAVQKRNWTADQTRCSAVAPSPSHEALSGASSAESRARSGSSSDALLRAGAHTPASCSAISTMSESAACCPHAAATAVAAATSGGCPPSTGSWPRANVERVPSAASRSRTRATPLPSRRKVCSTPECSSSYPRRSSSFAS